MIMYMDGFRFSLKGGQPCLNLFFPEWTLDSKGKFVAAMVGVLLLAVAVEGVSKLRYCIIRAAKASYRSPDQNQWNLTLLRFGISSMHGAQALFGYIIMLATMTFSLELLSCVILGLGIGYGVFFQTDDVFRESGHVTTNPCCAFMEDEVKDLHSLKRDVVGAFHPDDTPVSTTVSDSGTDNCTPNPV